MDEATYAPAKKRGFIALAFYPLDGPVAEALGMVPASDDVRAAQSYAVEEQWRRLLEHRPDVHAEVATMAGWYVDALRAWSEQHGPVDVFDPSMWANFYVAMHLMMNPPEEEK